MSITVALHHKTTYLYDKPVAVSPHLVRLRPAPHTRTPVVSYSLRVAPGNHFVNWQQDPHSNYVARFVFPDKVRKLEFEVDLVAELTIINPFDFFLEPDAETFPFAYEPALARDLAPFLEVAPPGPLLRKWVASVDRSERATVDFLVMLNQRLATEISYVIRLEPGVQAPEETLKLGSGSCRDTSWLLVQILRHLGLAARFVSGYLIQLKPDVKSLDGPSGAAEDFTDLHAWAEVFLPGAGWVGLDPTSGLFAAEGHIPLAATPEPGAAAPIAGLVDPAEVEFRHDMAVTRVLEVPRVTKPYTEEQWQRILDLGERVDADLAANDVRLTMGGEPTFVSIDDMDGAQWNTAALGEDKFALASELVRRLRERFAPGALLHFGQGRWYPGETLPRWALNCYWRTDGVPLWKDPELLAQPASTGDADLRVAARFAAELAGRLDVDPGFLIPAFEDSAHFALEERRLPINVEATDDLIEGDENRDRLRQVFRHGLTAVVGYVLPIACEDAPGGLRWSSSRWHLRTRELELIPGDSPIGLRLPLASLPWVHERDFPWATELDPTTLVGPLPHPEALDAHGRQRLVDQEKPPRPDRAPRHGESASWVVRTALCFEVRDGTLYIFLPPAQATEHYIALVDAIERTAADLGRPVVLEGYTPPADPRLRKLSVTPDPGVIEVNIHPSSSWSEIVEHTTALYEEARLTRLGTEKFMLDGRHTGTGGGNHITVGGATPLDSPLLRRPDLLRSLIGYWIDHPSLSYLFSGLFIGPTSQAPRVDEARHDALYELSIAASQVPNAGDGTCPPWLVDRIFRHLLTDATGNTHRAEFCIDKLYAPETASGRLGLLELRAFEMPPHARMSLVQQLLLRSLVSTFWTQPYAPRFVNWGTQLHDRFMLPHFVEEDFRTVVADLGRAGLPFERDWFAPHIEFRFPRYGRVAYRGVEVELRQALEPWHVLGEEPGAGGTARFVDSSVERVQVRVQGLVGDRYVLACNGRVVPLHPTGTHGEWVAGVRYRAWQPPNCLHPTIPVHAPLIFDLVDVSAARSIGGCRYHVAHPAGRNYETFPVNANEAEGRRISRFEPFGHTPGPMDLPQAEKNPFFPLTLDLRRA
jgi:uncharacterized protein (DUF2126 family)